MTSYRFDVGAQGRFVGRLMGRFRCELSRAVAEAQICSGVTLDDIAEKMGVERKEVEDLLSGEGALSLRKLVELLAALEKNVTFEIGASLIALQPNHVEQTGTVGPGPTMAFGAAARPTSTIYGIQQAIRKLVHAGGP